MICLKCNHEIAADAEFCPLCGRKNDGRPNFCKHCGAEIENDMAFCVECGHAVEKLEQTQEESDSTTVLGLPTGELVEKGLDIAKDVLQPKAQSEALEAAKAARNAQAEVPTRTGTPAQGKTPVRAPASVRPAAPAVPHAPIATTGAQLGAQIGAEVLHTGTQVVTEGVKTASSAAKTVAIGATVVAILVGAVAACLNFFVQPPEETVTTLCTSIEEMDYDGVLDCIDSKTGKQIKAALGVSGNLIGSLTGIDVDLEDLLTLLPSLAPDLERPNLGVASTETVLYADCSTAKILEYCEIANNGGAIPEGYLSDNSIISFLQEYDVTIPDLENLIAKTAVVKITLSSGEVSYLPMVNEGYGDWRIFTHHLMEELKGLF